MAPPFLNTFKATPQQPVPPGCHKDTPVEEYDFNYVFDIKVLRSDRVELRPFVPSLHAQLLYDGYKTHPDLIQWWGSVPWQSVEDVLVWAETICRRPSDSLFYAIFTDQPGSDTPKTDPKDYVFAGVMGQISSSYADSTAEPGFIMILKAFQRTHVLTHAAGLMMHQILDLPAEGGLGLRRCQWHTTSLNVPSQKAALRLGYKYEGTIRAQKVLPPGKIGARAGRKGVDREDGMARDNWWGSVIWEDWEGGVRDHIDKLMARRS